MTSVLIILVALALLGIIVTVHELGHFLMGRLLGFSILEFSVGMGPVILKKESKGIQYSLRALPIGGMCRFYGEDAEAADGRCFNAQKLWKRFLVVVSGPVMNFLFALLLCIVTLVAYGDYVPKISEIPDPSSPAYLGGMRTGDIITEIDGKDVQFYAETVDMILAVDTDDVAVAVLRDGQKQELMLRHIYNAEQGRNLIGITIEPVRQSFGLFGATGRSLSYLWNVVTETFAGLGRMIGCDVSSADVAGPVGIIVLISDAVRYGLETVLRFAVVISLSLGITNLLPLPALDGGRLVFMVVEGVRGKPIPPEKEGMVHFVGLVLLFGLVIFLTYNDITNLIKGIY